MTIWLILSPLLPLGAAVAILLAPRRTAGILAAVGMAGSLACLLVMSPGAEAVTAGETWMRAGSLTLEMSLRLDGLAWWMGLVVTSICLLVFIYSIPYVEERPQHFFALMSFFGGSMLALVLADSFPLLFVAWEGVGVASLLLIAHHHREHRAREAARKAFLMTRLGDVGLLIGWLLIWVTAETSSIQPFLTMVDEGIFGPNVLMLLAFLFLAAAIGKSAQLPLTAWLPDAMAGPTPVSALLHSATMVAAGIYLILRLFPLFDSVALAGEVILWIGAATALFGALVATMAFDLKRILAWSTVSQLGEMMIALGLLAPVAAAFHLTTHAVFKSALFLAAGALERASGTRDVRELARKGTRMPWIAGVFAACALALAAFPPFAGFWSGEKILGAAAAHGDFWGGWMVGLVALAGMYIGRAAFAVFGRRADEQGDADADTQGDANAQGASPSPARPPAAMTIPMLLLAAGALGIGFALRIPIDQVLPFDAPQHDLGLWRWAAIAASAVGLLVGALSGGLLRRGAPSGFPAGLAAFVDVLPLVVSRIVMRLASAVVLVERGIDAASAGIASLARGLGRGVRGAEHVADRTGAGTTTLVAFVAGALNHPEKAFDRASRGSARAALAMADVAENIESGGFGRGIDRAAYAIQNRGGSVSRLESGKIYRYTLSLFVWVLVAVVVVMVLWS